MLLRVFRAWLAACALACTGLAFAADPELPVPTAEDFGAIAALQAPHLSPDGKRVAAHGHAKGTTVVLVIDVTTSDYKIRTINLPPKSRLEWLRWAGNDRILVSLSKSVRLFGEDMRLTRLIALDLTSGEHRVVGPKDQGLYGDELVHVDPDGKYLLLNTQKDMSSYPGVYRVDLDTGKTTLVTRPVRDVWYWYADAEGVVRAGIGVTDGAWWLLYRTGAGEDFAKSPRRRFADRNDNVEQLVPVFGSDQGYAIAAGESGRFGLYRYNFKTDSLGERIYENPNVDIDDFDLGKDGAIRSVSFVDDRHELVWFDPELRRLQAGIDKAIPDSINRVVSISADKQRLLVWAGSATQPGSYLIYDRPSSKMDILSFDQEKLRGKRLSKMEPVRYKARDGLEIRAYLTIPAGKESAVGLPLIVMPHGGPFARDSWGYDPWVQYLAAKGYAVLQPNFRGSTGFGRDFVEKGTGQWGRGMQDDIDDGVKWLADKGVADPKRVCIMGASFGGYAAMWAAVRNPELYRCAISFAGISDVSAMLRYDRKSFSATRYFRDWRDRVKGDKSFELDEISPLKQVEKLSVPILIAHGSDDDNVPPKQSKRLHDALTKLGREHEFVLYEGEGHGFDKPEDSTDFLKRVGAFLDKHNPL